MKYPKISRMSLTIARNYAYCTTTYESGRTITRHIEIKPESIMLYPMDYLKETRRIRHIIYQFATHGYIPMSIKNWMSKEHPHASFMESPLDSGIFTMRLDTSEMLAEIYEQIGYERFNY